MMTVRELIETLEQYDDDLPVAVAVQPSWPLAEIVANVVSSREIAGDERCDEHDYYNCDQCAEAQPEVIWLATQQTDVNDSPYAPNGAWGE